MRVGSLSRAYIATDHSGSAVLGIRPRKTEGRTHANSHNNPQASLCACETVFWEEIQLQGPCYNDI